MLVRFKVTALDGLKRDEFLLMKQLNSVTPLNISDVYHTKDADIITIHSYDQLEKLLSPEATAKLNDVKLRISPPPNYKPERSVFVPRVPVFVSNAQTENLLKEINENNDNLEAMECVIIEPSAKKKGDRKTLKVVFKTIAQANQACETGFSIGEMAISPDYVHKEDYYQVAQCYKCFSFNHTIGSCQATASLCSICAGTHNYRECNNKNNVRCANCGNAHKAISPMCPQRKEAINKMKNTSNQASTESHQPSTSTAPQPTTFPQPSTSTATSDHHNAFPAMPTSRPNAWTAPVLIPSATPASNITAAPVLSSNAQEMPPLPQQSVTHKATPQNSHNNIKEHEWQIKLEIWKTIAEKIAGDDYIKYTEIMNSFITPYNIDPIVLPPCVTHSSSFQCQYPSFASNDDTESLPEHGITVVQAEPIAPTGSSTPIANTPVQNNIAEEYNPPTLHLSENSIDDDSEDEIPCAQPQKPLEYHTAQNEDIADTDSDSNMSTIEEASNAAVHLSEQAIANAIARAKVKYQDKLLNDPNKRYDFRQGLTRTQSLDSIAPKAGPSKSGKETKTKKQRNK